MQRKVYLKINRNRFIEGTRLNVYIYTKQSLVQAHCLLLNYENSHGLLTSSNVLPENSKAKCTTGWEHLLQSVWCNSFSSPLALLLQSPLTACYCPHWALVWACWKNKTTKEVCRAAVYYFWCPQVLCNTALNCHRHRQDTLNFVNRIWEQEEKSDPVFLSLSSTFVKDMYFFWKAMISSLSSTRYIFK